MLTYYFKKPLLAPVFLAAIFTLVGFYSCTKDNVGGPPVIEKIRVTNPALKDSVFDRALPGTFLVIEGRNLANAQKVLFNGMPAYFNPAYNSSTHIFVQIPAETPTPDLYPDVTNTITVVTSAGEVAYNFTIVPPPPLIQLVNNENPLAGEQITITGMYFHSVKEVNFPGGLKGTNIQKNDAGTQLTVNAPAGLTNATGPGKLELVSEYGNAKTIYDVNKISGPGVISNLDDVWNYSWPNSGEIEMMPGLYPNSHGKYLRWVVGPLPHNDNTWWNKYRGSHFAGTPQILEAGDNGGSADSYALKFEVNTRNWNKDLTVRISFNEGAYSYTFAPHLDYPDLKFNTNGKWITYTIPLNLFKVPKDEYGDYVPSGANMSSVKDILDAEGKLKQNFYLRNKTIWQVPLTETVDLAFDNFRIVKIK